VFSRDSFHYITPAMQSIDYNLQCEHNESWHDRQSLSLRTQPILEVT